MGHEHTGHPGERWDMFGIDPIAELIFVTESRLLGENQQPTSHLRRIHVFVRRETELSNPDV